MKGQKITPPPLAVLASEAARLLGISDGHFRKLKRSPLMRPRPVQLGLGPEETGERGERWNVAELTVWLNAGCPCRERWDDMKATRLPQCVTFEQLQDLPPDDQNRLIPDSINRVSA